ncbi:MAG TPA: hypothetical protein VK886_09565 [Vicinamibacterales bacterium]|nr:hypothetical protein [Vicinamibacterales bacterium]
MRERATWLRALRGALLPGVFAYLVFIRTHTISEQFWLLGEQVRDWRIALGPLRDLPLVGTPSTAGGTTLGPVYYWVLWLIRVVLGPLGDNLPHVGGVGLSIVQSGADTFLLYVLVRRLGSVPPALAVVLLGATTPYDMALTATVWNPPLAVALAKCAIGVVLLPGQWSLPRAALVVALAWLSVHAHTAGVFVAVACIGWMLVQPLLQRQPGRAFAAARLAIEIVLVLQVPYVVAHLAQQQPPPAGSVLGSVRYSVDHPEELRVAESAGAVGRILAALLLAPYSVPWAGALLIAAGLAGLLLHRRDPAVLAVAMAPLLLAVAGFSTWRGPIQEHYWFLTLVPSAALTLLLPAATRARAGQVAAWLALAVVLVVQPARCRAAWQIHRLPEYGALVSASRQIVRQAPEIRDIEAPFLPPTSDPRFIYTILGGRVTPEATLIAHIDPQGGVVYSASRED